MEAAGVEPLEPYPGTGVPWRSRCRKCGHEVFPQHDNVRAGNGPCRYCAPNAPVDVAAAIAVMMRAQAEPLAPFPGVDSPWACRCLRCDRKIAPRYKSVRGGNGACRHCAAYGLDRSQPAVVYVMAHRQYGAVKVGIASVGSDRITRHQRQGWQLFRSLAAATGDHAWKIEQEVLRRLRQDLGLSHYLTRAHMPKGGWTETFDADAVPILRMWQLIKSAAERLREDSTMTTHAEGRQAL
ncbi:hypothetical protein [Streptomyces sp. NBC_01361]|uniref:hypothetical protein n=1 Tax=Streptomyces sp. NBC_01361 TaxID=2903838 RepID=UPI002E36D9CE|nr:hypothetical protein [Streptomyces sp. NBC_01361]